MTLRTIENPSRRRLFRGNFAAIEPSIRLPYVTSEQNFVDACTRCNKCIDNCETSIIKHDEFGYPQIDFTIDECTFCGKCEEVCEQSFFIPIGARNVNSAWSAQITIKKSCLAINHIYCQSCQDVCDSRAITFAFTQGAVPTPSIAEDNCNNCGACVSSCPQNAISITPIKEIQHG